MQPIEIKAEWNSDKAAWIATSVLFDQIEIEAPNMEELVDCLRVRIMEVLGREQISRAPASKQIFILTKTWPVSSQISIV